MIPEFVRVRALAAAPLLALLAISCSKTNDKTIAPPPVSEITRVTMTVNVQLADLAARGGSAARGVFAAPLAVDTVEVRVTGTGIAAPIVAGARVATADTSAAIQLDVPWGDARVFTVETREGALVRGRYVSAPVNLHQAEYTLAGSGPGGTIAPAPVAELLAAGARGAYRVDLRWQSAPDADLAAYLVSGADHAGISLGDSLARVAPPDTACQLRVARSQATYYFRVFTLRSGGVLAKSNEISSTTGAAEEVHYGDWAGDDFLDFSDNSASGIIALPVGSEALVYFELPDSVFPAVLGKLHIVLRKSDPSAAGGRLRPVVRSSAGAVLFRGASDGSDDLLVPAGAPVEFEHTFDLEPALLPFLSGPFYAGVEIVATGGAVSWGLALDTTPPDEGKAYLYVNPTLAPFGDLVGPANFLIGAWLGLNPGAPAYLAR